MPKYKPMIPKFKKLWVKALRSKKFDKTTGTLRRAKKDGDGFCCLGVLCEITGGVTRSHWFPDPEDPRLYGYAGTLGLLPDKVQKLTFVDDDAQKTLAIKNDHGWSFDKIADWIEANL